MIFDTVSRETSVPYTSARCAWTSPVVNPLAVSETTISRHALNRHANYAIAHYLAGGN